MVTQRLFELSEQFLATNWVPLLHWVHCFQTASSVAEHGRSRYLSAGVAVESVHTTQLLLCSVLAYWPGGHAVQSLAAPVEKVPAMHSWHASLLPAPVAVAKVPGRHG